MCTAADSFGKLSGNTKPTARSCKANCPRISISILNFNIVVGEPFTKGMPSFSTTGASMMKQIAVPIPNTAIAYQVLQLYLKLTWAIL